MISFRIGSYAYLLMAVAVMLLPLPWLVGWVVALAVHELSHYLAVSLCGGSVLAVSMEITGMQMVTAPLTPGHECICALAGPLGGCLLLLFRKWMPFVAVCAFVQTLYNLLPIYPLDGGRVAHLIIRWIVPPHKVISVTGALEWGVLLCVSALGVYSSVALKLGILPVLAVGILVMKNIQYKKLAKKL